MIYTSDLQGYRQREKDIMKALKKHTLGEVSKMFGMTYQRVQQIRLRAENRK